jgi:hypothetical protein
MEKRRALRRDGLRLPPGETFADLRLVAAPREVVDAYQRYVCKITCATIYRETGIIPTRNALFWSYARPRAMMPPERIRALLPFALENAVFPTVQKRSVSETFSYAWTLAADRSCFSATYEFGMAFTAVGACIMTPSTAHTTEGDWFDALGNALEH